MIATPVERGTRVAEGADLIRVSPAEAQAQATEAEANAAQLERRLGLGGTEEGRQGVSGDSTEFETDRVPGGQRPGAADPGDRRIRSRQDAVRQAAVVEGRLRSEERAGGSGAAAARDREKRRDAAVSGAPRGPRPRHAGEEGAGRHDCESALAGVVGQRLVSLATTCSAA